MANQGSIWLRLAGYGLRRKGKSALALDYQPFGRMALIGLAFGLLVGLPLAVVLHHPWALPLWLLLAGGLVYLARDAEPVLDDLGLAPPPEPRRRRPRPAPRLPRLVRDGPIAMVELPAGSFLMGSPDSDDLAGDAERPRHPVTVSQFLIARAPVTRGLWREVMGSAPSQWTESEDTSLPANHVSWEDAAGFCNALSRKQGRAPCYDEGTWTCDWSADGYRLPTEAEWEYACRAGTSTRWFFGDQDGPIAEYAWYGDLGGNVHPVGEKRPNPWQLQDMIGNVWEWCCDWYGPYGSEVATNPRGPGNGKYRVLRGGSFYYPPESLRSAFRDWVAPWRRDVFDGFRCVRVPARQH